MVVMRWLLIGLQATSADSKWTAESEAVSLHFVMVSMMVDYAACEDM